MSHSFDAVDNKVAEAEFFLAKMGSTGFNVFEFRCYFSAFMAASRTITLALQQFRHIPGFAAWYAPHQQRLAADPLAKFFLEQRNIHIHGGDHPVNAGYGSGGNVKHLFANEAESEDIKIAVSKLADIPYQSSVNRNRFVPEDDALSASRKYFVMLLAIVYDCYVVLGRHIDPQQHYTKENFASMGRDISCAEAELWGFELTELPKEGFSEDDRWHHVRAHAGCCSINGIFHEYLGKVTPSPPKPEGDDDCDDGEPDQGARL